MSMDLKYNGLQEWAETGTTSADSSEDIEIKEKLKASKSVKEACLVVENVLATQLAKALNMEKDDVDLEKPMHSFGGKYTNY